MTFDQWAEAISKQTFLLNDEDSRVQTKFVDLNMGDEDLEAEES